MYRPAGERTGRSLWLVGSTNKTEQVGLWMDGSVSVLISG